MTCPNCGTSVLDQTAFCPNCGTSLKTASAASSQFRPLGQEPAWQAPLGSTTGSVVTYSQPEEKGRRIIAYLIDIVPLLVLSVIHLLPIFGWMVYGLLHACYWLFRDINGASLGKMAMGSFVASENGSPATTNQRILRNVPLAIPGILGMIPVLGIFFEFGFALFIFLAEGLLMLATGKRLGDRLAGTMVFRK